MPKKNVAKLDREQVMALRRLYADDVPVIRISRIFGISQARVREAAVGLTYKTVPGACEPRPWPRDNRPAISAGRRNPFRGYVNMAGGLP